jgi:hypothetical protein
MKAGRMRATGIAAAIAAVTLAAGAPPAAGDGGAKTKIVIKTLTANKIAGRITSDKEACERNRHVQVFRLDDFFSVKVVRGDAQNDGEWKFTPNLQPGRYFAKVDSRTGCRYDVSDKQVLR